MGGSHARAQTHLPRRPWLDPRAVRAGRPRFAAPRAGGRAMNQINAPDGTPLVYDAYEPARPAVAVLFLHDWHPQPTGAADRFSAMGTQLQAAGFAAYCLDQRGHGRSGGRRGHLSRFSQLLGDLQALRRAVRRRQDVPQVLAGRQRIGRPLLFILGAADTVTDAAVAREFADHLAPRAAVHWHPELSHDLVTAPQVLEEMTRFVGAYGSA